MSRNKRAKHSKESLYPLFDDYAKSEEGRTTFCERHGIGLHNYNYWWAKYRKEKGLSKLNKNKGRPNSSKALVSGSSSGLVTIPSPRTVSQPTGTFIKMESVHPVQTGHLTLRTAQGVELLFEQLPPVSYLQELLNLSQNP